MIFTTLRIYRACILLCALMLSTCALFKSSIKEIHTLKDADQILQAAGPKTLVVFDMDDTLITPDEPAFHLVSKEMSDFAPADRPFIKNLYQDFAAIAAQRNDPNLLNKLRSAVFARTHFSAVEDCTAPIIQELQTRGIKVIALTSSNTGTFFDIPSMESWRYNNLQEINLDLSTSFECPAITFNKLEPQFGNYPTFCRGILCAAGNPKGNVLAAFLNAINWHPDQVIFFDDGYHHCQSVLAEMKRLEIRADCFWYKASTQKNITLNQSIIKQQLNHWIESAQFLKEKELAQ